MNPTSQSIAQIAADLAGNPDIEQDVEKEIQDSAFVTHLLSLRVARKLTQEDVAKRIGCTSSKISRLESGNDKNLKWPDIEAYVQALGLCMTVIFDDPSLPAAVRIKECVFRIHKDLESLTDLAKEVGGDDEIAKKIHQFSGEVLFNFIANYKTHSDRLGALIKVGQKRQEILERHGATKSDGNRSMATSYDQERVCP